jgi:hypothetical protein
MLLKIQIKIDEGDTMAITTQSAASLLQRIEQAEDDAREKDTLWCLSLKNLPGTLFDDLKYFFTLLEDPGVMKQGFVAIKQHLKKRIDPGEESRKAKKQSLLLQIAKDEKSLAGRGQACCYVSDLPEATQRQIGEVLTSIDRDSTITYVKSRLQL